MEGEGVALGKPRDGEGKLGSDTAGGKVGKLFMCSLTDPGLENRLLCGCCVETAVGTGMAGTGAVGAGPWAGDCSLADSVCAMSTVPLPASDPKSRAPNWTFRPGISAEPGISTADEGIFEGGGTLRLCVFSCR